MVKQTIFFFEGKAFLQCFGWFEIWETILQPYNFYQEYVTNNFKT